MSKPPTETAQTLLQAYHQYLIDVVGLSPTSCQNNLREITRFLESVPVRQISDLAQVGVADLTGYLSARSIDCQPSSLRQAASSLRGFLRFCSQQGWVAASLSAALPKIACRSKVKPPAYLSQQQLDKLLACWDCNSAEGRRDRAICLCLARLGMRAGEVAALLLDDLNWPRGSLRLNHRKNKISIELPLLDEVGKAIVAYLRKGRPICPSREVFLRHQRPGPINAAAVSRIVARGLRRCGLEVAPAGAHLLRHTLATHLVGNGATLKEVADLLGHRHLNSTEVYAHVQVADLRTLAQPWPKEATP